MDMSQMMSFIVIFKFDLTIEEPTKHKTITMPIDYKKLYLKTLAEKKALKKENQELKSSGIKTVNSQEKGCQVMLIPLSDTLQDNESKNI